MLLNSAIQFAMGEIIAVRCYSFVTGGWKLWKQQRNDLAGRKCLGSGAGITVQSSARLVPALSGIDDYHDEQHHRNLDQDTDHGGKHGTGLKSEWADRSRSDGND